MIFYFTGTGNSHYAAKNIGENQGEDVISIAEEMKRKGELKYNLKEGEILGFVFPVYTWAPPRIVLDFIKRMNIENYNGSYVFSIAVCGDTIGCTIEVINKALERKGIKLSSGFSLIMPNNYIVSFDVDSKELELEKLSKADEDLEIINNIIKSRKKDVFGIGKGLVKGHFAWFLTRIFSPVFFKFMPNIKKFYATNDCTGCGQCQRICPTGNISLDKRPSWGSNCTLCLACANRCPKKAIQYGKSTLKRRRYQNPIYRK